MAPAWVASVVLTFAATGGSEALDPVMGIYEGSWTDKEGETGKLTARIAAWGGDEYVGMFGAHVDDKVRTYRLAMRANRKAASVTFAGKIDLGSDAGGAGTWKATLSEGVLTGSFDQKEGGGTFRLTKVHRASPTLGAKPPKGAVVLFDGKNFDQWVARDGGPPPWKITDGAMQVAKAERGGKTVHSDIISKRKFEDMKVHLEFRTPFMPKARGQARGNSGVYLQGRYEVQVLDSFGEPARDNEAGGIYKIAIPEQNASLPPGEWQTYDITFHAPRFTGAKLTDPARITVLHNGVKIHSNVDVPSITAGGVQGDPSTPGPILLQDHGNPVRYRNVWVLPLAR